MACSNCVTQEQVINLINLMIGNSVIPRGLRATIGLSEYTEYFDSSGLGMGEYEGWAVSNGSNGTTNRLGKMLAYFKNGDSDFGTVGASGGSKTVTLTTAELPAHTHIATDSGHSHGITDTGHNHTFTTENGLTSTVDINTTGAGSVSPTGSVGDVTLKYNDLDPTLGGGVTYRFLVADSSSPTEDGTEATVVDNSTLSVAIADHDHSNLSLSHNHTGTTNSSTTGLVTNSGTASVTLSSSGSGGAFSILPPYIVEVPIEKIT